MKRRQQWLLYDGQCPFCTASAERLRGLSRDPSVSFVPFQSLPGLPARRWVTLEECEQALHLVDDGGNVFRGVDAVVQLLSRRWWGFWMLAYRWFFVRPLIDRIYAAVARRRTRLGQSCQNGTCALHTKGSNDRPRFDS